MFSCDNFVLKTAGSRHQGAYRCRRPVGSAREVRLIQVGIAARRNDAAQLQGGQQGGPNLRTDAGATAFGAAGVDPPALASAARKDVKWAVSGGNRASRFDGSWGEGLQYSCPH